MTFGSLFSGIGGFDLGFERAGMKCAWQCEIDKHCQKLLRDKWPHAQLYDDVTKIGVDNLGRVDLICGGFPCQDVSVAGKRAGLAGERSGLWHEFRRILDELRPGWTVIENVPGLLSSNGGRDFAAVIRGLVELGYGVSWRILDAQYFGLAQRRKRVFIVGHFGDGCAAEILFERQSLSWDSRPSRTAGQRVAKSIMRGSSNPGVNPPGRRQEDDENIVISGTLGAHKTGGRGGSDMDTNGAYIISPSVTSKWAKGSGDPSGDECQNLTVVPIQEIGKRQSGTPMNGVGYGNDGDPMFTLQRSAEHGVAYSMGVRRLMPIECERLQGFPDNHTAAFSDSTRYRMLGNAVAVPVAEWIGQRIIEQAL